MCTRFLNVRFTRNHLLYNYFSRTRLLYNRFFRSRFLHDSIKIFQKSGLRFARLTSLIQKPYLRATNCGAILIEFAVCMPVLIILLFYINDLVKIKRYYSQTEFVAQQMVNIIQNISQKRENKKITANDLKYATALASQTIYPGTTLFWKNKGMPFLHFSHPIIYYVEGNKDGTATTYWRKAFYTDRKEAVSPATIQHSLVTTTHTSSVVTMGSKLQPSQIYPTLKIGPGEVKIILEVFLYFNASSKDVNGKSGYTDREAFGCRLVSPKHKGAGYFHSVVIFTPKPGLFSETAPS